MVSKVGEDGGVRGSLGGGQGVPSRANVGKSRAPQQNQQLQPATHATAETQKPWKWIHPNRIGARMYSSITMYIANGYIGMLM
jgi:hypothetical protein